MIYMGIDPGLSGAIAFLNSDGRLISVFDTPIVDKNINSPELARIISSERPEVAIIESVNAMPGQGVSSMFRFGQSFGTMIGVVSAFNIPLHFTSASRWKKHFRLSADKEEARSLAVSLWPSCDKFSRKKDHGRAEAALLARYLCETSKKPI